MNKRLCKLMASLVALLMTFSFITASAVAADKDPAIDHSQITVNQGISDFVTRLYDICLDRTPDPTGFKTWTEQLSNGENTGVGCAYGFIFSNEFQNKNVSNDQYIELMYNCFFGRTSDPEGKANWLNAMNSGMTREELFLGFANSVEFFNLCKTYGITAGCHVLGKDYQKVAKINLFVERLYNIILSRPCDQAGMIDWSTRLANKEISGAQAAYGFIFSDEYRNKNRSDSDFLEDLYLAFMGRASDQGGKAYWQNQINIGRTDRDIFNGFTGSQEFIAICNDYGINKGGDITSGQTSARVGTSGQGGNPTIPTNTPTPAPTQPVTPVVTSNYDPDNHGGYWIYGVNGTLSKQVQISTIASNRYSVIANSTEFNSYNTSRCYYVCSSGYVISYSQYSQMNWSQASDPMFGAQSQATSVYRGSYWQQGCANDATAYLAAGIYGTSAATDAFDYDGHVSGKQIVGMYCGNSAGQTYSYKRWDGDAVTNGGYTEIYNALLAYNRGARHSATILAKYGITNEGRGDYLMIEWCEGNTSYNVYTLPLPDFNNYCAMGSDSAHTHFVTNVTRNPGNSFAMSKSWNYNNRSANVVNTSGGTSSGSSTISYYELQGSAFDADGNTVTFTCTGNSKSNVKNQYNNWVDNHGYIEGSYNVYAVYSDGFRRNV